MQYYPIYLNITNKRCIVVGGGPVGERKAERLLDCGARVTVVGRKLTKMLMQRKREGRIEHRDAEYTSDCLEGSFLVIGATSKGEVNAKIARDARRRGIMVNIADDPEGSDFIHPSLITRGDLKIALSTGGKSPALAGKMRRDLEKVYGPEYGAFLTLMGDLRKEIIAREGSPSKRKGLFEALAQSEIPRHIREEDTEGVRNCVRSITGIDLGAAAAVYGKG